MNTIEQTSSYLKTLLLPVMRQEFEKTADRARAENFSYEEYLQELAELEVQQRNQKRYQRWVKESNLPSHKLLTTFDRSRLPQVVHNQVKILMQGIFVKEKENVLLFGTPGSGKTHLMCGLAHHLLTLGYRCYFRSCHHLLQDLLLAKRELRVTRLLNKLASYDVLVIDEVGYIQQEKEEMELLFQLFAQCYEQSSILLTSNLPFSKWETIFKDPIMAAAAIDRLIHHSVVLEMNLESYRLKASKKKKEDGNPS